MILKPDYNVKNVFEVNFDKLKEQGIKVLIFDLDSTVMKSKAGVFSVDVLKMFDNLSKDFMLTIASNNKNIDYINKVRAQVNFPVIGHANKPSPAVIKSFLEENAIPPKDAAMIGDRPLTDILVGKLLGSTTVLVDSISKDEEPPLTRFVRRVERLSIR